MASITPPFGPIKRISGFKLDSASSTFSDSSTSARETNSIQSISPNMLSAPVQLGSSYEPRSGLWSSFTAGDEPSPGVSRGAGSQTYFSEDGHLPGSVPFSTSFTTTVNQPSSQAEASQSRHAHSLSMPLFSPDTSAPLLMSHLASYGAKNDAEASFYPNYVHESWSPSLTPATGKAPSSRSRSQRRSSLGSPHLGSGADDIPKSQIPRTAEQRSGAFYRRQSIASDMLAFRSNQIAPSQPSSMPTDPIPPRPDMSWMREFNSDRFPELSKDSPALFDQYQSGSAPGSLNLPSLLHFDRLLPSPEGDASSKPPSAADKRKKRRESHNMVERRRRDGINAAIERLSELLPEMLLEPSGTGQTTHHSAKMQLRMASDDPSALGETSQTLLGESVGSPSPGVCSGSTTTTLKPNKAVVLCKTVEYVQHLQELVQIQARRNQELEASLGRYRSASPPMPHLSTKLSPVIAPPPIGQMAFDEELFDMTSNMELS